MDPAEEKQEDIGLLSRVSVRGRTPVGGRPVASAEGRVVERGESGLLRVLLPDGRRRWFWPEELQLTQ